LQICMISVFAAIFVILLLISTTVHAKKIAVFGATGGLGQWCCNILNQKGYAVSAVTRDIVTARTFDLLNGCNFVRADARVFNNALIDSKFFYIYDRKLVLKNNTTLPDN